MRINEGVAFGPHLAAGIVAMSAGRLGGIVAAVIGLMGVAVGARALARSAGRIGSGGERRTDRWSDRATAAVTLGLIGIVLGGLVVATSDGGLGTGSGLGGAYVAIVVGLTSVILGGLAWASARRLT